MCSCQGITSVNSIPNFIQDKAANGAVQKRGAFISLKPRIDFTHQCADFAHMRTFLQVRLALLVICSLAVLPAIAQTTSKPSLPSNSYMRSRQSAVRLANQAYRDAQAKTLKAKTDSERSSAERSLDTANSRLKSAEDDLDRAQRDYDRQMNQYDRDLESYQKYLASKRR